MKTYEVFYPDWEIKEFQAFDHENAVKEAHEYKEHSGDRYCSEDFYLVREKGETAWRYFVAEGQQSIDYYACEKDDQEKFMEYIKKEQGKNWAK